MKNKLLLALFSLALSACERDEDPATNVQNNFYSSMSEAERAMIHDVSCGSDGIKINGSEQLRLCKFSLGGEAYVIRVPREKWCSENKGALCYDHDSVKALLAKP